MVGGEKDLQKLLTDTLTDNDMRVRGCFASPHTLVCFPLHASVPCAVHTDQEMSVYKCECNNPHNRRCSSARGPRPNPLLRPVRALTGPTGGTQTHPHPSSRPVWLRKVGRRIQPILISLAVPQMNCDESQLMNRLHIWK